MMRPVRGALADRRRGSFTEAKQSSRVCATSARHDAPDDQAHAHFHHNPEPNETLGFYL
jgi:hypothetical protein